jgi:tRNA/tmRNA/rRNA uracil-C5-methylase (TrmA/RlmC/RlmD family)
MLGVRPIHARFCKPSIRLVQTILRTRATIANMSEAAPTFKFSSSLTTLDTEAYDIQLAEKRKIVEAQFADFNPPCLEVFRSQPKNYRMR